MSAALKAPETDLLGLVNATHSQNLKPAADGWREAVLAARAEPADIDRNVARLILAAETMQLAAKHVEAVLRSALLASMEADGVTSFEIPGFTISRRRGNVAAVITDAKALAAAHPELLIAQEPKPDRAEIARRLKANQAVAGASLGNGAPALVISSRKD